MTLSGQKISAKSFTLKQLRKHLERRVFAVPEIQREFVWNEARIPKLLDSIFHGYPIGAPLIWKTTRANSGLLRQTYHLLPPYNAANRDLWVLVDGQQRLSVLCRLLLPEAEVPQGSAALPDFGRVYFDVQAEEREPRFHYRKGKPPEHYVRVVDILHDRWRTKIASPSVRKGRRIEECRNRILDYELWLTFITTKSVEDVRETFIRVNEQGMRITSADRAFARASNFNLRNLAKDVQVRLGDDFGKIKFETVLAAAAIAMDETDVGGRALDHLSKRASEDVTVQADLRKVFQSLTRSFPLAQDHLRKHFSVIGLSSLPSETMLAVLAAFFHLNRNKQPSRAVQAQLRRWFWGTAIGSRYTGRKFRPCFHADVEVIRGLAARKPKRFQIDRVPLRELRHTDYQQRGTLRDAYFCMLRRHGPRYLEDAVEILVENPAALGNRNDKHHIFPRKLLKTHGVAAAQANVLANICFLVARENQSVGSKHPREYLRAGDARRARSRAAASHLIPIGDSTWLDDTNVKRGFKAFLDARASMIARRFEVEAGDKLFDMRE